MIYDTDLKISQLRIIVIILRHEIGAKIFECGIKIKALYTEMTQL